MRVLIVAVAAVTLAACFNEPETRLETTYQNRVDIAQFEHEVPTSPATGLPNGDSLASIEGFLTHVDAGYGDVIVVTGGEAGVRHLVAERIARNYPALRAYADPNDAGAAAAPLRLVLERAVATPPPCGDWSQPAGSDFHNRMRVNFGCSNTAALGMMVADPRHLVEGKGDGPADSQAGARAVDAYRTGALVLEPQRATVLTTR